MNPSAFLNTNLGATRLPVFRLGLAATYRPGQPALNYALDQGVNYLFSFAIDTQMNRLIREMNADRRERVVIATGAYNWIFGHTNPRKSLENALRRLKTDYIDVFHFLGITKPEHFPPRLQDEFAGLRSGGKVRSIAISCHDRKFAAELALSGAVDVLMIRYNAAHPGAESEVFPYTPARNTGVVSYTATRWARLLVRPRGWPASEPVATPGQCYRFVLSNSQVHVALMAPRNGKELRANLDEVARGPLPEDEMSFMRRFGAYVHDHAGWFMGN